MTLVDQIRAMQIGGEPVRIPPRLLNTVRVYLSRIGYSVRSERIDGDYLLFRLDKTSKLVQ